jgi:hypothetical protein
VRRPDRFTFDHGQQPKAYWAAGVFLLAVAVDVWRTGGLWFDCALVWAVLECGWYLWRLLQHNRWYSWRDKPEVVSPDSGESTVDGPGAR